MPGILLLDIVKKAVSKKMIYSTQQDRWDFMSIECRNNRTDAIAMEAMSKEFSGVARTPGDAASQRHVKLCERNIARSGQHIVGVMENAASKTMFLYTVGNAMDGGSGVPLPRRPRLEDAVRRAVHEHAPAPGREGHPVFAGQRAGSEDGRTTTRSRSPPTPRASARISRASRRRCTAIRATRSSSSSRRAEQGSLAQGLVDMGVEESFEAAARKVAEMGPLPIGNDRDGYRPAGRAQTAKEIIPVAAQGHARRSCYVREDRARPRQERARRVAARARASARKAIGSRTRRSARTSSRTSAPRRTRRTRRRASHPQPGVSA